MYKFFFLILKQKKIIFFVVLFLVVLGTATPQNANATAGEAVGTFVCDFTASTFVPAPVAIFGCGVGSSIASALGLTGDGETIFDAMVKGTAHLLVTISSSIASYIISLFSTFFSQILYWHVTSYDAFSMGWTTVRDIANMLIVLGFVIVGVAFTLRLEGYGSKKVLTSLILVALLINFSNVFVGIIIDASNITMRCFVEGKCTAGNTAGGAIGPAMGQNVVLPAIKKFGDEAFEKDEAKKETGKYVAASAQVMFMYIIVIVVFGYMLLVMFERYIMLGILFMLSPLAFFAWVFPATKKYFTRWWEEFLKWAFMGIGAAFFIWLATKILAAGNKIVQTDSGPVVKLDNFALFLALILLFVSFKIIKKSSVIANAVIGVAKTAAGVAIGAGIGVATGGATLAGKGLDKALGGKLSSGVQAVKGGVGRTMERMSWLTGRKEGTTAMKEGAAIAEEQKRYEMMFKSGNASDKTRAMEAARTGRGRNRAGAYAAAVSTGNLNDTYKDPSTGVVNVDAMARGATFTEQFGAGENMRKEAEKQIPELARYNKPAVEKIMQPVALGGRGITNRADAEEVAVVEANQNQGVQDRRKVKPPNMTAHAMTGSVEKTLKAAELMSDSQRQKYVKMCDPTTPDGFAAQALATRLRGMGLTREADNIENHLTDPRMSAL